MERQDFGTCTEVDLHVTAGTGFTHLDSRLAIDGNVVVRVGFAFQNLGVY
jgi:hypothetical protein